MLYIQDAKDKSLLVWTTSQAALAGIAFALMLTACGAFDPCNDPRANCIEWEDISYANNTEEKLFVDFTVAGGDGPEGYHRILSGETRTVPFVLPPKPQLADYRYDDIDDAAYIYFRDDRGCTALVIQSTVRKIREEHDSSFTIRQSDLIPQSERGSCDPARLPLPPYR